MEIIEEGLKENSVTISIGEFGERLFERFRCLWAEYFSETSDMSLLSLFTSGKEIYMQFLLETEWKISEILLQDFEEDDIRNFFRDEIKKKY